MRRRAAQHSPKRFKSQAVEPDWRSTRHRQLIKANTGKSAFPCNGIVADWHWHATFDDLIDDDPSR